MSNHNHWLRYLKWILIILVFSVIGLFLLQNSQRPTMIDSHDSYLSLDLYFYGLSMKEPMSISWLLCIAFALGILFSNFVQFVLKK